MTCPRFMTPRYRWRPWWFDRLRFVGGLRRPPGERRGARQGGDLAGPG